MIPECEAQVNVLSQYISTNQKTFNYSCDCITIFECNLVQNVQTCCETHPASCPMGIEFKAAGAIPPLRHVSS
jgi:hypothetical protein